MLSISSRLLSLVQHIHPKAHRLDRIGFPLLNYPLRLHINNEPNDHSTLATDPPNVSDENTVLEVYDVPYEQQWEENPQFDYCVHKSAPFSYDFVTSSEHFELDELQMILKQENVKDLVFLSLPPNHVAEHMVIGSGNSARHVRSTADLIYRILKYKRRSSPLGIPRVEGLDGSGDWIAIHLGNILLHLFMPSVRMYYNLESLWVAGARFDESSQLKSSQLSSKAPNKSVNWEQILQEVQQEHLATSNTNSKQPELTSKPTGRP